MRPLTGAADTPPDEPARLCPSCHARVHRYGWAEDRCQNGHIIGILVALDPQTMGHFRGDDRFIFAERRAREAQMRIEDLERALALVPPRGDLSSPVDAARARLAAITDARSYEDRMRAERFVQAHAADDIAALLRAIDDTDQRGAPGTDAPLDCDDCGERS